ncbi:MAG: hypothetical protein B7Z81_09815 [Acidocella sp. 20-61-6]|nr:MAG: hypothetical protein B7Z81_09815 [Acidocella sp. 20-61-6]
MVERAARLARPGNGGGGAGRGSGDPGRARRAEPGRLRRVARLGAGNGRRGGTAGGPDHGAFPAAGGRTRPAAGMLGPARNRRGADGDRGRHTARARSGLRTQRLWLQPSATALGGHLRLIHGLLLLRARLCRRGCGPAAHHRFTAARRAARARDPPVARNGPAGHCAKFRAGPWQRRGSRRLRHRH